MNIEEDIVNQVQQRMASLLHDDAVADYRQHEVFHSNTNQKYQFLIWKYNPKNLDELIHRFSDEVKELVTEKGYQLILGANSMSNYDLKTGVGYQVTALYKPE